VINLGYVLYDICVWECDVEWYILCDYALYIFVMLEWNVKFILLIKERKKKEMKNMKMWVLWKDWFLIHVCVLIFDFSLHFQNHALAYASNILHMIVLHWVYYTSGCW